MRRIALVLAACASFALLLWLTRLSRESAPASAAAAREAVDAAAAAELAAPSAPTLEPVAVAQAPAESAPRVALTTPAAAGALELLVVDAAHGLPIAGAELRYLDPSEAQQLELQDSGWELGALDDLLVAHGFATSTDANGVAHLPASEPSGLATARAGSLYGMWWFSRRDPEPYRLELLPDQGLRVRALDSDGRALVGLPLQLRCVERGRRWPRPHAAVRTDARGEAAFRHAAWTIAHEEAGAWSLRADALCDPCPAVALDPAALPTEPIELRLPPCGSVEVELRDPDGSLRLEPVRVCLASARERTQLEAMGYAGETSGVEELVRPSAGGRALFEHVALGGELLASVQLPASSGRSAKVRCAAPRSAGERVGLVFDLGATSAVLVGQLLDAQGRPCAGLEVSFALEMTRRTGGQQGASTATLRTDAEGRWRADVPELDSAHFAYTVALRPADDAQLSARWELPADARRGSIDLGARRLQGLPFAARGHVLDPAGEAVANAEIWAVAELPPDPARPAPAQQTILTTRSAADGSFALADVRVFTQLRIDARKPGYAPSAPLASAPSSEPVTLRLEPAAALSGSVRLGDCLARDEVGLALRRIPEPGEAPRVEHGSDVPLQADGGFRFADLAAGRYSVSVKLSKDFSWDSLANSPIVEVARGAEVELPAIDLSSSLRCYEVEVVDEQGRPIAQGTGSFWKPGSGSTTDIAITDGRARIRTQHESVEAWLGADGRRCVQVPDLRGATRVVLGPPLPVRLRLRDPTLLPPPPYRLWVELHSGLGADNWILGLLTSTPAVAFDERGEARVELPVALPHSARFFVSGAALGPDGEPRKQAFAYRPGPSYPVLEQPAEQLLTLELDADLLGAALLELQQH